MNNNLADFYKKINEFEQIIKYKYKNVNNLILALTHSSYANENRNAKMESNERLEFLGDAVLNIAISEKIFFKYSHLSEGEMTKARANIVCETTLGKCANHIEIGQYLLLGKGEELTGGRTRTSLLSDAFEALIGSIYIDGGIDKAKEFIFARMKQLIENAINGVLVLDYKTQLQEIVQKRGEEKIIYEIIEEKGPDHEKIFVSQVRIDNNVMGTGQGKSKKEAEQNAAKEAIEMETNGDGL